VSVKERSHRQPYPLDKYLHLFECSGIGRTWHEGSCGVEGGVGSPGDIEHIPVADSPVELRKSLLPSEFELWGIAGRSRNKVEGFSVCKSGPACCPTFGGFLYNLPGPDAYGARRGFYCPMSCGNALLDSMPFLGDFLSPQFEAARPSAVLFLLALPISGLLLAEQHLDG